jgi:flagellar biosynthesis/type III secretory pathway chaperone
MKADLRTLFADLVQSLHEESDALIRGDADEVAALATRKQALLQRLAPLATQDKASLPRDLVERARDLNDRNALLLAPRLVATRARLEALRQAGNPALYGSDGLTQSFAAPFART